MRRQQRIRPAQSATAHIEAGKRKSIRIPAAAALIALAASCGYLASRGHSSDTARGASSNPQPSTEAGRNVNSLPIEFEATIENRLHAPGSSPMGMVWIPGGEFSMGANDPPNLDRVGMRATLDARPIHRVYVDGFSMDKTDVTNAQFAEFVKATRYVTVAERTPRAEDFPGAPPENLVPASVVFSSPDHAVPLNNHFQWWTYVKGADWRHPSGPQSSIVDEGNYPVVHVAYDDAAAYARWAGKRLP